MEFAGAAEAVRNQRAVDRGIVRDVGVRGQDRPFPAGNAHAGRVFEISDDVERRHGAFEIRCQVHAAPPVTFTRIVLAPLRVKLIPRAIPRELAEILNISVDPPGPLN
jgi:hypothetical protein